MTDSLDQKKLNTIMKRFLSNKKGDPDYLKFYMVDQGVDYYATTLGSAIAVMLKNKYDKRNNDFSFVQPLPKEEKNITDHVEKFPNIKKLFKDFENGYSRLILEDEELNNIQKFHESVSQIKILKKETGSMKVNFKIQESFSIITFETYLYDSFSCYKMKLKNKEKEVPREFDYYYDNDLMLILLKSLNDFSPESKELLIKDPRSPLFLTGQTVDYHFNFALNRVINREDISE